MYSSAVPPKNRLLYPLPTLPLLSDIYFSSLPPPLLLARGFPISVSFSRSTFNTLVLVLFHPQKAPPPHRNMSRCGLVGTVWVGGGVDLKRKKWLHHAAFRKPLRSWSDDDDADKHGGALLQALGLLNLVCKCPEEPGEGLCW